MLKCGHCRLACQDAPARRFADCDLRWEVSGLEPEWREWDTGEAKTPEAYRGLGSPTALVDGRDLGGGTAGSGMGCVVGGRRLS